MIFSNCLGYFVLPCIHKLLVAVFKLHEIAEQAMLHSNNFVISLVKFGSKRVIFIFFNAQLMLAHYFMLFFIIHKDLTYG